MKSVSEQTKLLPYLKRLTFSRIFKIQNMKTTISPKKLPEDMELQNQQPDKISMVSRENANFHIQILRFTLHYFYKIRDKYHSKKF